MSTYLNFGQGNNSAGGMKFPGCLQIKELAGADRAAFNGLQLWN